MKTRTLVLIAVLVILIGVYFAVQKLAPKTPSIRKQGTTSSKTVVPAKKSSSSKSVVKKPVAKPTTKPVTK